MHQLKHLANAVRALRQNLLKAEEKETGRCLALMTNLSRTQFFGHPQVASVGLTERDAKEQGLSIVVARKDYGATAYGWAMEDSEGFVN